METATATTETAEAVKVRTFETETCSRCGGSGNYSFCPGYGTTCFRCGGAGKTYTKRGQAARAYFESLCTVPASEVKVGDMIEVRIVEAGAMGITHRAAFSKVLKIEAANPDKGHKVLRGTEWVPAVTADMLEIETVRMHYAGIRRDAPIRVAQSRESKLAKMTLAMAYEDTLTKAGTPRKRG